IATDTLGLLLAIVITAASVQDTSGGKDVASMLAVRHPTVTAGRVDGGPAARPVPRGGTRPAQRQPQPGTVRDPDQRARGPAPPTRPEQPAELPGPQRARRRFLPQQPPDPRGAILAAATYAVDNP
ncbi:MAG TPA: hypothetical protein VMU94_19930, partial [Streptosporangiaceae bacterium]|nr:hypothetical protein [Streptosporangiaceae bacterium]